MIAEPLVLRCPSCGAANRVPPERINGRQTPVCGRCKALLPLPSQSRPFAVTDATFAADVENAPLPVVVDMWAPWCGPCRMIAPILDSLAEEMGGRVAFAKMNVDDNPSTAQRFGIQSIPALLIFKDGREVDRIVGAQPKAEIARRVRAITGQG